MGDDEAKFETALSGVDFSCRVLSCGLDVSLCNSVLMVGTNAAERVGLLLGVAVLPVGARGEGSIV